MNGSNNTIMGSFANVSTDYLNNATAIGANAIVSTSNTIQLGDANITNVYSHGTFSSTSDARFKYDVHQNVPGLAFINKLKPVTYHLDRKKMTDFAKTGIMNASFNIDKDAILNTGFLAQDVEIAAKEIDFNFDGVNAPTSAKDHYSLAYSQFVVPLVKAVQELNTEVEKLKAENANLKNVAAASSLIAETRLRMAEKANEALAERMTRLEKLLPSVNK